MLALPRGPHSSARPADALRRGPLAAALVAALGVACLAAGACGRASGAPAISGQQLYDSCQSCHGVAGEGTALIGAPAIAGLPSWYLTTQLQNFRAGRRGKHPDDLEGLRMRAMSMQMMSDAEVTAVVDYIAALAPVAPARTLTTANPALGQPLYVVCLNCHGPDGQGIEALKAPPIARLDDWYIARQLRKFQSGVRGRADGDITGLQMAAMAATVPADRVEHLAAYVRTLAK